MINKLCDICKKNEGINQIGLIMYDVKNNQSEKGTSKIIGAVSICGCESCFAKMAWKKVIFSILQFLASVLIVSLLTWLIAKIFKLSWIGGGLIVIALFIVMIKKIVGVGRGVVLYGAISLLEQKYEKQGFIPKQDFFLDKRKRRNFIRKRQFKLTRNCWRNLAFPMRWGRDAIKEVTRQRRNCLHP